MNTLVDDILKGINRDNDKYELFLGSTFYQAFRIEEPIFSVRHIPLADGAIYITICMSGIQVTTGYNVKIDLYPRYSASKDDIRRLPNNMTIDDVIIRINYTIDNHFNDKTNKSEKIINASKPEWIIAIINGQGISLSGERFEQHPSLEEGKKGKNILGQYYRLEDINPIESPRGFLIRGIDATSVFESNDAEILSFIASTSKRIRRFLPQMDLSTKEAAEDFLISIIRRTEFGAGFAYSIRVKGLIVGLILVNTPAKNVKFSHWSLDFFIMEAMENKGIMYESLWLVLRMMKDVLSVPEVYIWVDPENAHCLSLIAKLPFDEVQHDKNGKYVYSDKGKRYRLFYCDLRNTSFVEENQ